MLAREPSRQALTGTDRRRCSVRPLRQQPNDAQIQNRHNTDSREADGTGKESDEPLGEQTSDGGVTSDRTVQPVVGPQPMLASARTPPSPLTPYRQPTRTGDGFRPADGPPTAAHTAPSEDAIHLPNPA